MDNSKRERPKDKEYYLVSGYVIENGEKVYEKRYVRFSNVFSFGFYGCSDMVIEAYAHIQK